MTGVNLRFALNDLRKNRGVNSVLLIVLILSAFLMATSAMVFERTFGAVDALFAQAEPPHFLQMHAGEYDLDALESFAREQDGIDEWLIEDMVGFDSAAIYWQRPGTSESGTLEGSLIDNLFVVQNADFDFLLGADNAIVDPAGDEIYVPVSYEQQFALKIGDELSVRGATSTEQFVVAGFVRDSQMASSLSSATRFVVSEDGFQSLRAAGGSDEIIVEYRLTDPALANDFQAAYEADVALPKNGQAVTGDMIRIINAISDGLSALALMFVSLLLIAIALVCLRFVIRGTLEDEVRQIGAMKAIGLRSSTITGLYLSKYVVMVAIACLVGGVIAIFAVQALTSGTQANYAAAPVTAITFVAPIVALAVVFSIVTAVCWGVLRRVQRIQVVSALVHGSTRDERQTVRHSKRVARRARSSVFARFRGGSINRLVSLSDLRSDIGQWVLIPLVFALAIVLIAVPTNLLTTFQNPTFVTYMGAPEADLRVDVKFSDDVEQVAGRLDAQLHGDSRLGEVRAFANELVEARAVEGWESMRIEVGNYDDDGIEYVSGGPPAADEIALSALNAEQFGLDVGDELSIRRNDAETELTVSGVYQDITGGGRTAKLQGDAGDAVTGYVYYAEVAEGQDPTAIAAEYSESDAAVAAVPLREYVTQTLSYVTRALQLAATFAIVFSLGIAALVVTLFLNLRLARERRSAGVLSALGFSGAELAGQMLLKTAVTVAGGTVVGLVLVSLGGGAIVSAGMSLSGLGLSNLALIPDPALAFVVYPLLLIATGMVSAAVVSGRLRRGNTSRWLRA